MPGSSLSIVEYLSKNPYIVLRDCFKKGGTKPPRLRAHLHHVSGKSHTIYSILEGKTYLYLLLLHHSLQEKELQVLSTQFRICIYSLSKSGMTHIVQQTISPNLHIIIIFSLNSNGRRWISSSSQAGQAARGG